MARPAGFDLARELAKPSFTPGVRDAAALVDLIVVGDEPSTTRAAPALAGLGEPARAAIEARLAELDARRPPEPRSSDDSGARTEPTALATRSSDAAARRTEPTAALATRSGDAAGAAARLIGVLGLIARAGDPRAATQLIARTDDPAPRVRKAAAIALGKLGGDDARRALIARWDAGDAAPDERRALAEALGKVGGDEALRRLKALDHGDDGELMRRRDRAIIMADRTARRDETSQIVVDTAPPMPLTIQLGCRPGLGALLGEELAALGFASRPIGDRGAELSLAQPLTALFAARLWATLAIQIPLADRGELATAITQTITAPPTLALLRAWTRGPIRWRLGFGSGHKRAVVWRVARDVTAAVPALINDPTSTTWDIVVDNDTHSDELENATLALVPRKLDDPRFAYRVAEVPAASHPTVAAAIVRLADPTAGDRVWDPFCGSGLELVERARSGPARSLLGTDLDPDALAAARQNLDAANVQAELTTADARSHAPGPIDLILTNPPLGSRVHVDAAALLIDALPNFVRALVPGGRLVWISPAPRKTAPVAEQLGLTRSRSYSVDLGGVRGQLERWERP